jgi:hypothetical protein
LALRLSPRWRLTSLVRVHGEAGWTARPVPLTVDGLIYASSMVMLDSARRKVQVPALAQWLLGLGIAATLAANVAHGLGHGLYSRQLTESLRVSGRLLASCSATEVRQSGLRSRVRTRGRVTCDAARPRSREPA